MKMDIKYEFTGVYVTTTILKELNELGAKGFTAVAYLDSINMILLQRRNRPEEVFIVGEPVEILIGEYQMRKLVEK